MELEIETARVFVPLLAPARYKGAWGGRGSGKSHFFAERLIEDCLASPGESGGIGMRGVCIREVQKTLKESSKRLIEDKLKAFGLSEADGFKVFNEVVQTPGDGLIAFQGMQDHNAESIKSLEGFSRAWVEEAQTLSQRSLQLLRPTIRAEDSELWFSWNPRRKSDAVDEMLRGGLLPTGSVVVSANWRDNPKFPKVLEQERLDCLRDRPEQYDHIWEGGYATVLEGAYYAYDIAKAKADGRIGRVAPDPLMAIRLFCDIGGTGAKADAFAIWAAQFIGKEIRALDYYEQVGQPLAAHLTWMRAKGYTPDKAQIWLPHDGETHDRVYDVSYESALRSAGYSVTVVKNQGKGAAANRIESGRRMFPSAWFHQETTQPGLDALGWYHEKKDPARDIGLGPDHDWSSHGCFDGRTRVLTRYGTHHIMDLPKTGEVLTPCGWKQYVHPRMTKRNAPLVEVVFTSGYSVRCTPDHLFLTDSGWKSAESLTPNTAILSTLTRLRSISMAASTVFGPVIRMCLGAGRSFIETLGLRLSDLFRPAATSIIGTGMFSTTGLRILSASTGANIFPLLGEKRNQDSSLSSTSANLPATRPPSGTAPQRGGCGTSGTPSAQRVGRSGNAAQFLAGIAGRPLTRSFVRAAIRVSIVLRIARWLRTGFAQRGKSGAELIASVRPLSETADVWDITVPDGHCFSLENGAIVHNSDAFGLMCVVAEESQRAATPINLEKLMNYSTAFG